MSELVFIMSPPFLGVMQTVPARRLLVGNANIRAETMHLLDHHHPTIHSESRMSLFQITVFHTRSFLKIYQKAPATSGVFLIIITELSRQVRVVSTAIVLGFWLTA